MATYNILEELFQGIDNVRNALSDPNSTGRYYSVSKNVIRKDEITETHYTGSRQAASFNIELDCGVYISNSIMDPHGPTTRFNLQLTIIGVNSHHFSGRINDATTKQRIHSGIDRVNYEIDAVVFYHKYAHRYYLWNNINTVRFKKNTYLRWHDTDAVIYHNYNDLAKLSPIITIGGSDRFIHDPITDDLVLERLQPYLEQLWV